MVKQRLIVVASGYYPFWDNPMGIVFEKLQRELQQAFDLEIWVVKRERSRLADIRYVYAGASIRYLTNRLNDWLLRGGGWRVWGRLIVMLLYSTRGKGATAYYEDMIYNELKRENARRPVSHLLSLSFPLYCHEACRRFKLHEHSCWWVAYSTDTCFGNTNLSNVKIALLKRLIERAKARSELYCYRIADRVMLSREIITNNQKFLEPLMVRCRQLDYSLYDQKQVAPMDDCEFDASKINLVFAGGFAIPIRNPKYFIEVLLGLPETTRVVWHVFLVGGNRCPAFDDALRKRPDRFVLHKPVDPLRMRQIMMQADILVNLGNNSDLFSPSKLYDYVSTGKPIISTFYAGRKVNPILESYPLLLSVEEGRDAEDEVVRMERFCEDFKGRQMSADELKALYPNYMAEHVTNILQQALLGDAG